MELSGLGKVLMIGGAVLFVIGLLFVVGDRIPFLGRLPGDIHVERKGFSLHFPIVTCIVISVLLTLIVNFFTRK